MHVRYGQEPRLNWDHGFKKLIIALDLPLRDMFLRFLFSFSPLYDHVFVNGILRDIFSHLHNCAITRWKMSSTQYHEIYTLCFVSFILENSLFFFSGELSL